MGQLSLAPPCLHRRRCLRREVAALACSACWLRCDNLTKQETSFSDECVDRHSVQRILCPQLVATGVSSLIIALRDVAPAGTRSSNFRRLPCCSFVMQRPFETVAEVL